MWLWHGWDVGEEGAGMCSATFWIVVRSMDYWNTPFEIIPEYSILSEVVFIICWKKKNGGQAGQATQGSSLGS